MDMRKVTISSSFNAPSGRWRWSCWRLTRSWSQRLCSRRVADQRWSLISVLFWMRLTSIGLYWDIWYIYIHMYVCIYIYYMYIYIYILNVYVYVYVCVCVCVYVYVYMYEPLNLWGDSNAVFSFSRRFGDLRKDDFSDCWRPKSTGYGAALVHWFLLWGTGRSAGETL